MCFCDAQRELRACGATREGLNNYIPIISMDYNELGEHVESKSCITTIVCMDKATNVVAAHVAKATGSVECATGLVEFLGSSGCTEVVLTFNGESAIKVLGYEIANVRAKPIRPTNPMRPQTHGRATTAVQDVTD